MRGFGDGLGLFGLLLLLLTGRRNGNGSEARLPDTKPRALPASTPALPSAPWPAVVPAELPRFPGSGWEYDEPPPVDVQRRAAQLVDKLWSSGAGSHVIEQTAGRWIAYRGEIVRSGRKGVVAYRLKTQQRTPAAPETMAKKPAAPPRVVRSPGIPQTPRAAPSATSWPPVPGSARVPLPSPLALPMLRVGMGMPPHAPVADVALLQSKLAISADGRFGKGTLAAVRAFQSRSGLAADGVVGPNTWSALFAARS